MLAFMSSIISETGVEAASISYDRLSGPAALVFCDDPVRGRRLAAIADGCGARAVATLPVSAAAARLECQASGLVLLDLAGAAGAAIDGLLDALAGAAALRTGSVVIAPAGLIDAVARALDMPSTTLLIEPGDRDVAEAIAALLAPAEPMLNDSAGEANGPRLRQLSEEIGRIARTLASLSSGVEAPVVTVEPRGSVARLQTARAEIRLRRLREQFFDRALFADPAWDMLLDLAAAEMERRRVSVSSLCIAAAVPPTTALRWIAQMTEQGLLVRYPDPDDGRRVFIALSEQSSAGMTRYLDACAAAR